jgi:hypothetical protein
MENKLPSSVGEVTEKETKNMSLFNPASIDFGLVDLAGSALEEVMSAAFPSAESVTAAITDDTSGGGFTVETVTSYQPVKGVVDDPGVRHGKPVVGTDLEQIGRSNGVAPLPVSKGQIVAVDVRFTAPVQSTADTRTATLQISGDKWGGPVSVPLTALAGRISVEIPPISIEQSQTISVPFTVTAIGGPPTTVTLTADEPFDHPLPPGTSTFPPGIFATVTPASLQVSNGNPGHGVLTVSAARTAGIGVYSLTIYTSAFNGAKREFSFKVNVGTLTLRRSPIDQKYAALGGPAGVLGQPTAPEAFCSDFHGQFRSYANGAIYWSGSDGSGAFEVHGPTWTYWVLGSDPASLPSHILGYPTTDVSAVQSLGTYISHFQHGAIYSKRTTGTHAVWGPIYDKYAQLGEASGALGFPIAEVSTRQLSRSIPGPVDWFGDFENGGLFSKADGIAERLIVAAGLNAQSKQLVLDQVNGILDAAVAKYNRTADHAVSMQGGPAFQSPPLTDYSVAGSVTQNRQYKLRQDFFVSLPIFKDTTMRLTFDLLLSMNGTSTARATLTNVSVNIDTHGNPLVPGSAVQQAHDSIIVLAAQADADIPLPGGPFLSLKVLTTGAGVLMDDAKFQALGGAGTLALLLEPST